MTVKGNQKKDASQETAETAEVQVTPSGQFAVPSNAIHMVLSIKEGGKVGDVMYQKVKVDDGTGKTITQMVAKKTSSGSEMRRNRNVFAADILGVEVNIYGHPEKLPADQDYDLVLIPRPKA